MSVFVLLVNEAYIVEAFGGWYLDDHRSAKLSDSLAKRLRNLLERRQVAAARKCPRFGSFLRFLGEPECRFALHAAATNHVLHARREMTECVLPGIDHLQCDEDHLPRGQYLIFVEHER